jgi:hypothetical protein
MVPRKATFVSVIGDGGCRGSLKTKLFVICLCYESFEVTETGMSKLHSGGDQPMDEFHMSRTLLREARDIGG